ncbi:MAG: hypothetical protein ACLFS7_05585 [Desulfosudaceae bacterium]
MLDVSVAYNRYKFLGHEFLTWLWFMIEQDADDLKDEQGRPVLLRIGNRIVLENNRREAVETITIKGSESELEEGRLSVKKGAVVTEMNLYFRFNDQLWIFDIKGESLDVSGLKVPEKDAPEEGRPATKTAAGSGAGGSQAGDSQDDTLETSLLTRMEQYDLLLSFIHYTYFRFVTLRLSDQWREKTVPRLKKWIKAA